MAQLPTSVTWTCPMCGVCVPVACTSKVRGQSVNLVFTPGSWADLWSHLWTHSPNDAPGEGQT
jgi:hypothetical protein